MNVKCKYTGIAVFISVLSFIVSIVTLCLSFPTIGSLSFDYQGVIVGILSLLVTVLIGMQIYNYIIIKEKIDKRATKIAKRKTDEALHDLMYYVRLQLFITSERLCYGYINSHEWLKYIIIQEQMISYAIFLKEQRFYDVIFENAESISCLTDEFDNITMSRFQQYIKELESLSSKIAYKRDFCISLIKKYC